MGMQLGMQVEGIGGVGIKVTEEMLAKISDDLELDQARTSVRRTA